MRLSPERERELAEQYGFMTGPPRHRYDLPEAAPSIDQHFRPYFYKALQLVDRLSTVRFWELIDPRFEVDMAETSESWADGYTCAFLCRTDVPPPSNRKIWGSTGIKPNCRTRENFYMVLRWDMITHAMTLGCWDVAPPLVFETEGDPHNRLAPPYMGLIVKFLRRARTDKTLDEQVAQLGALVPPDSVIHPDNVLQTTEQKPALVLTK